MSKYAALIAKRALFGTPIATRWRCTRCGVECTTGALDFHAFWLDDELGFDCHGEVSHVRGLKLIDAWEVEDDTST